MSCICSRYNVFALAACLIAATGPRIARAQTSPAAAPELRVCADPNNLPFSNRAGQGLENQLAQLIARDLGARVTYTWFPQRGGFLRHTLAAGACDVVLGVPADDARTANTRPYYASSYVFVTRRDRHLDLHTLDQLRGLRIGLHAIGAASVPPAMALARLGITDGIVGYSIYGDYREPNPPAELIDAVARGDVDVAIAWGPLAGYFARSSRVPLVVTAIESSAPGMEFAIAVGVRRSDRALRDRLDAVLVRERAAIAGLLRRFGVPRAEVSP